MPVARAMDTLVSNMIAASKRQDIAANNLANVNTTGFKKDQVSFATQYDAEKMVEAANLPERKTSLRDDVYYGHIPVDMPVKIDAFYTSQSQGNAIFTGNPLDVAIEGEGYFVLQTPEGERYSRAGGFRLNEMQYLVNQSGYAVMGQNGPINLAGETINILESGEIQVDGALQDQLRIVTVDEQGALQKDKDSFYSLREGAKGVRNIRSPVLQTGTLESSNVKSIEELNSMTINMRAFEASSKAVKTVERTVSRAINGVGKA
ncbi:flagellar hook-basal body protein [Candidatus Omnitrophota bacterium]